MRLFAVPITTALATAMLLTGCPKKDQATQKPSEAPEAVVSPENIPGLPGAEGIREARKLQGTGMAKLGETIFATRCLACHGDKGQGGMGPALGPVDKKGDAYITQIITEGKPESGMPGFEGQLGDDELKAVVTYIKDLP